MTKNNIPADSRINPLASPHFTHGDTYTRLYNIWHGMRNRCRYPSDSSYKDYGGCGITVCPEWNSYIVFRSWAHSAGYADDLTLDRITPDGPYEPSNCRWISASAQRNNTRRSRWLTIFGEEKTLADWARDPRCEVGYETLKTRLRRGIPPEQAMRYA